MTLVRKALAGLPLSDETIIDGHMHFCSVSRFFTTGTNPNEIISVMDRIGVSVGVVSNLWNSGTISKGEEDILNLCRSYPGRFWGQISPNPNFCCFRETFKHYAPYREFRGIKLHPFLHKKNFLCDEYRFVYSFAAEYNMPVLLHTWDVSDIIQCKRIAIKYPHTNLIMGHSGGERKAAKLAIQLAADYQNLYLDTARSYCYHGEIEEMVRVAGPDKILYGSDAVWNSIEAAVGRIIFSDISEQDKLKILGENTKKLYSLR